MSEPVSISSGIADRYAIAIFELAREGGSLEGLEANLADLAGVLEDSAALRETISSPVLSRADQEAGIAAVGDRMGLIPELRDGLALMARKRRLFVLPQLIARLRARIAAEKDETTAEVTAARALSGAQTDRLAATLRKSVGKDVKIAATVDESLIGGLVVRVGSKTIDASVRSRLDSLRNAMKEVG